MQTTTDLVATAAEFAASMQDSHDDFQCRETRTLMVLRDRNSASIVRDCDRAIGVNDDGNFIGIACHHFVDAIIDHLLDEVVQTALVGRPDIHTRPYTYS